MLRVTDIHPSKAMPYKKSISDGERRMATELKAWDGVMPPTWDDAKAGLECSKKFVECVLSHFQTVESTNELSRPCGYISFVPCHRGRKENLEWGSRHSCKNFKQDGSCTPENDLVHAGWESITL